MALDEFIYGKFSAFLRKRKEKKTQTETKVTLDELRDKLHVIARAVNGAGISIYSAKNEGGFKGLNFFLPEVVDLYNSVERNMQFLVYRVLYLSSQRHLDMCWKDGKDHGLAESRQKAAENSAQVIHHLKEEYPSFAPVIADLTSELIDKMEEDAGYWLYGKWMTYEEDRDDEPELTDLHDSLHKSTNDIKSSMKAKAVEEIRSVTIDKAQQEDYVLTHNFEKVETAEEFDGIWRDFDGDDALEDHAEALSELDMRFTVRADDPVHSVYQAEFIENTNVSESTEIEQTKYVYDYDEWDFKTKRYKPDYCKLHHDTVIELASEYYSETMRTYRSTLTNLRKLLSNLDNKYRIRRRQIDGESFDIDSANYMIVDLLSGRTPNEKIYLDKHKAEKDISILLLMDSSLSSDGYAKGNRIIDVEKQMSILFAEILHEFGIDFSISCFYSKTRNFSHYVEIKSFDEDWQKARFKVGAVQPQGYTRIGPALRHAGAILSKRESKNKWIILLSDGKPNDYDRYEGKYGIQDIKQALRELNEVQINSFALAIESEARYYLPQMFGQNHYQILSSPDELLTAMVRLYDRIKHG